MTELVCLSEKRKVVIVTVRSDSVQLKKRKKNPEKLANENIREQGRVSRILEAHKTIWANI